MRNTVDPFQQVRELIHLLLCEPCPLPAFDPRPCPDISDRILSLAFAGQVISWFARKLARQLDLENTVDTKGLVLEAVDGIYNKSSAERSRRMNAGRSLHGIFSGAALEK